MTEAMSIFQQVYWTHILDAENPPGFVVSDFHTMEISRYELVYFSFINHRIRPLRAVLALSQSHAVLMGTPGEVER